MGTTWKGQQAHGGDSLKLAPHGRRQQRNPEMGVAKVHTP